jgi:uncharacterized damage-inducible protein DinB
MSTTQSTLNSLVTLLRAYGHRLLTDLTEEELRWVPAQTQARSILSYFRHVVNAEIYWLKELGFSPPDYLGNETPFDEVLQKYDALESFLIQSIQELPQDQLELITPKKTGDVLTRAGTFGWMIWRTSFHAIHHLAQIASIRFTQGNAPTEDPETSWSKVMDQIIMLKCDSE